MPFTIINQDITKMKVDAIVNATNTNLKMGGGVCGAIFKEAGENELQDACDKLAPIKTGDVIITSGFKLPAKYIIHTAGPVYKDGKHNEVSLLRSCYNNALEVALEHKCESIAFPLISSGIYGYPKAEALLVATNTIKDFLSKHEMNVILVVFDKKSLIISEKLLGEVKKYIDEYYIEKHSNLHKELIDIERKSLFEEAEISKKMFTTQKMKSVCYDACEAPKSFDDLIGNLDEPFSTTLLRLIDGSGKKDTEIYHRANIDRRLFSKIRNNVNYAPSKSTVLSFAIALELSLVQSEDLLERAGFALSHSRIFDVIVEYFIQSGNYDIFEINQVLFCYDQPLLGS